jgi:hypothetical protein
MRNSEDSYESWKRRRGRTEPSTGFADAVMIVVHSNESRRRERWLVWLFEAVATSRYGRVGLVSCALVVFAMRLAAVIAVFVVNFANPLE